MIKSIKYEKIRFLAAGGTNTFFDFILLNTFVFLLGIPVFIGNIMAVTICITISYFLNHFFVFKHDNPISFRNFTLFFGVTGFSSLVIQGLIIAAFETATNSTFGRSLVIIGELASHQAIQLNIAKAMAVLTGMVWNYLIYKHVIFALKES